MLKNMIHDILKIITMWNYYYRQTRAFYMYIPRKKMSGILKGSLLTLSKKNICIVFYIKALNVLYWIFKVLDVMGFFFVFFYGL